MWAIANGKFPVAEELISLIIEKNMQQCFLIQSVPDQRSFKQNSFNITSEIGEEKSKEIWKKLRKADILNNDNLLNTDLGSCSPTEYNEIYDKVSKCLESENQQCISAINNIFGDLSVRNNPLHLIIAKGYESIFWSNSASYTNLSITILNSLNDDQAHDIARQKNRYGFTPLHLALIRNNEKILKKLHHFYSPQELESAKEHIDSLTIQEKNNYLCVTSRNCFKHVTHLQMLTQLKVLQSQNFFTA